VSDCTDCKEKAMKMTRYLTGVIVAIFATAAQAQAPFQIIGLHPDMVFPDARAAIEKMGGVCSMRQAKTAAGDRSINAECTLPQASKAGHGGAVGNQGSVQSGPVIGAQPVTLISIEAPLESAQLTRIMIALEGNLDAIASDLEQQYGPPDHDTFATKDPSWSHSKRKAWIKGSYTLGLINVPQLVILTVNRPSPDPDAS
jgi:hypothetical protein